jgi:hypothetical protein
VFLPCGHNIALFGLVHFVVGGCDLGFGQLFVAFQRNGRVLLLPRLVRQPSSVGFFEFFLGHNGLIEAGLLAKVVSCLLGWPPV